jgi:hypothetical protein
LADDFLWEKSGIWLYFPLTVLAEKHVLL